MNTEITEENIGAKAVKRIRKSLEMTQAEVARTLGVSIRAIQSYEQGWRDVPDATLIQLLVLVAAYKGAALDGKPCWEITKCTAERQLRCPSRKTGGHLCWFVSGRLCGKSQFNDKHSPLPCLTCPVVEKLLT